MLRVKIDRFGREEYKFSVKKKNSVKILLIFTYTYKYYITYMKGLRSYSSNVWNE